MNILQQAARRLERHEALDRVAGPLAGAAGRAWCATCSAAPTSGIPCPPMLTDLPIGAWVMSAPLDAPEVDQLRLRCVIEARTQRDARSPTRRGLWSCRCGLWLGADYLVPHHREWMVSSLPGCPSMGPVRSDRDLSLSCVPVVKSVRRSRDRPDVRNRVPAGRRVRPHEVCVGSHSWDEGVRFSAVKIVYKRAIRPSRTSATSMPLSAGGCSGIPRLNARRPRSPLT